MIDSREKLYDLCTVDVQDCACKGEGWVSINSDWKSCLHHYRGNLHPEEKILLLDMPERLQEEQRKAMIRWTIRLTKERINELESDLTKEKMFLSKLEVELVQATATIKMPSVK